MVVVPSGQTCCGQPAYNAGATASATQLARNVITAFEDCDYLVSPSGSCAAMIRLHYPALFAGNAYRNFVGGYEDAWARLRARFDRLPRGVTLITGPSRSSDIERKLQIGVHGPRRLHVVLVDGEKT